jgi:DNA-binding response OmpR family regulator
LQKIVSEPSLSAREGNAFHTMASKRRTSEAPAVIVIEDDMDARRIYSEYLRSRGWTVFTAADGRTGLDKIIDLTPDAVVLDLAMPIVDGWTVLKHVRQSSLTAHIAVVIVSAVAEARDDALAAGSDAFLAKPCGPDVLHMQLRALMRLRGDTIPT